MSEEIEDRRGTVDKLAEQRWLKLTSRLSHVAMVMLMGVLAWTANDFVDESRRQTQEIAQAVEGLRDDNSKAFQKLEVQYATTNRDLTHFSDRLRDLRKQFREHLRSLNAGGGN